MQPALISFVAALALTGPSDVGRGDAASPDAKLPYCLVSLIDEARVPAQEKGVLVSLNVHEGNQVLAEGLLAQIDDREARMSKRIAVLEQKASKEEAENDIEVRFTRAAADVAEAEYLEALEANRRVKGTYSDAEVRRLELMHGKSVLQIEQSELKFKIAGLTNEVNEAKVEAADLYLQRRRIESPIDGEVVEVYPHVGEWVNPGDPIMRIVRMDRLRVEGFLKADDFAQHEIHGRGVTIVVRLPHGRTVRLKSKISYVNPLVEASGEYRVWAEVGNQPVAVDRAEPPGRVRPWLLQPGLTAEMTIHLDR